MGGGASIFAGAIFLTGPTGARDYATGGTKKFSLGGGGGGNPKRGRPLAGFFPLPGEKPGGPQRGGPGQGPRFEKKNPLGGNTPTLRRGDGGVAAGLREPSGRMGGPGVYIPINLFSGGGGGPGAFRGDKGVVIGGLFRGGIFSDPHGNSWGEKGADGPGIAGVTVVETRISPKVLNRTGGPGRPPGEAEPGLGGRRRTGVQ